jgi:hypothetical protein
MSPTKTRTPSLLLLGALFAAAPPARGQGQPAQPAPEERAVRAIEIAGGHLTRDEKAPGKPVTEVSFYEPLEAEALGALRAFPHLKRLTLWKTEITDAGLAPVAGLTALESLEISSAKITDRGLALLKGLTRLQELRLVDLPITDAGLAHLKGFRRLEALELTKVPITDVGLAHLQGLTRLRELDLSGVRIEGPGLAHLSSLPRLEGLRVSSVPLTDAGLAHVKGFPRLRRLYLWETKVTGAGVEKLKEALPYTLIDFGQQGWQEVPPEGDPRSAPLRWAALAALGVGAALILLLRPWRLESRRHWLWKLPLVLTPILFTGAELLRLAPRMFPVREGDPGVFWLHACQLDVGVKSGGPRGGLTCPGTAGSSTTRRGSTTGFCTGSRQPMLWLSSRASSGGSKRRRQGPWPRTWKRARKRGCAPTPGGRMPHSCFRRCGRRGSPGCGRRTENCMSTCAMRKSRSASAGSEFSVTTGT